MKMRVAHVAIVLAALGVGILVGFLLGQASCGSWFLALPGGRLAHAHAAVSSAAANKKDAAAVKHSLPPSAAANKKDAAAVKPSSPPSEVASPDVESPSPPPVRAARWLQPDQTALVFNSAARAALAPLAPERTTLHFTFGSAVMIDFLKNWLHFVKRAQLSPYLVGAADAGVLEFCDQQGLPAAAISPDLDVWTYTRKARAAKQVYEIKTEWKYFRHHDSDFLEMGLVKAAFLWELLVANFDVLISDLDVVWLNSHWQRWMTWAASSPPLLEASHIALADVLVTTDELDAAHDMTGKKPEFGVDLNTGVVHFRRGMGARGMVQQWRKAMLGRQGDKHLNENINDQSLFNEVMHTRASDLPTYLLTCSLTFPLTYVLA